LGSTASSLGQDRGTIADHFGVAGSDREFVRQLEAMVGKGADLRSDGLYNEGGLVATQDALAVWMVKKLIKVPDGITDILNVVPNRAAIGGALYNVCLETLRTSKGTFFTAEEIAARVQYSLEPNRKRRLRQLRRLLVRVCNQNGARIRRQSRAQVRYGFR